MTGLGSRLAAALCLATIPTALRAADQVDPRGDVETMEALLDRVVRRVSQPSAAPFFGATEASRAYRLQGYGVVFVVPPRALPPDAGSGIGAGHTGAGVAAAPPVPPAPGAPAALAAEDDGPANKPSSLDLAREAKARGARERQLQAIEAKVEALSREAERQRADAERALALAMQQVQLRLTATGPQAAGAASPAQPLPPEAVEPPPAPPWRFWLSAEETADSRDADAVVRDVKEAVTQAVVAAGARLRSVTPDEFVVVAVDFVPQWDFGDDAQPERTLVVRARKKDLVDRESGRLTTVDLRKRIEYLEY